ncbi:putative UPF0481 protein [Acorus gramineus]|uniref:UPF0481 protein n=1 Tax=Acorus gramineus TaxID=55184 RepID=A0AAV9BI75_ACOGR|nr:putative UPF0481 protein [Acorus gramineus]
MSTPTTTNPVFDEHRWVIHIRRTLDEDDSDSESGNPVSIFNVPKSLLISKPDCYVPQLVSLGPYHHCRPDLYEMERYKLSSAKRTKKHLTSSTKFQSLVDHFSASDRRVRAHYHRFLDFNCETLAWIMAVDASFLLDFLRVYASSSAEVGGDKALTRVSSRMSHLVDFAGRKSAHNAIARDVVMLENQVPLFLLKKVLDFQCADPTTYLNQMLIGFCQELSPFKSIDVTPLIDASKRSHVLDVLYHTIVVIEPTSPVPDEADIEEQQQQQQEEVVLLATDSTYMKQLLLTIWGYAKKARPFHYIKKAITSRPVKFVVQIPWKILTSLPVLSILKQPIEYFIASAFQSKDEAKDEESSSSTSKKNDIDKPPLVEEITIPSISELVSAGIRFAPAEGDLISSIAFDTKTTTFYLPMVSLDVNTETVMRNLVAYETSFASGPLVFTRYTELMNGIIDTEEDVRLLRRSGVLFNRLKSDGEVAKLWNGMAKSVRLTKVGFMDKVIEDVNRYYNGRWKIKVGKFMKRYVFASWPFLTFLAAILMILLTSLQAFCSVYSCARWFHVPQGSSTS